jgi:hypothetical protein
MMAAARLQAAPAKPLPPQAERGNERQLGGERARDRAKRVDAIEAAERQAVAPGEGFHWFGEQRERRAERRGRDQHEAEGDGEAGGVERGDAVRERREDRLEEGRERRKGRDEQSAGGRGQHLDERVGPHGPPPAARERHGHGIAEGQSRHERRDYERRRPDAVADDRAGLAEPDRLERKRAGAREKEHAVDRR